VEDDDVAAEVLRMRFVSSGFHVERVVEGYQAIDALRTESFDVVILDLIITAGLNGFGVLNFIELEQPELLDRVFVVSGMSEQTIVNTAPALLPRFFRKPFDDRKLVAAVKALTQPPQRPLTAEPRVLVADDDEGCRVLLAKIVEISGYAADTVGNGHDTIDRLSNHNYDVLVLDLIMPEIDGFSVLGYLEQIRPDMLPRTIITTGLPSQYRRQLDDLAVFAVAEKPFEPADLGALIESCLTNEKAPG
jgi:DNA-binding response OmpR family regulator